MGAALADANQRAAAERAARRFAQEELAWSRVCEELVGFYEETAGSK
jgi:hypothetical protein